MIPIVLAGAAAPSWWNRMSTKEKLHYLNNNPFSQFGHSVRVILNEARKERAARSRREKSEKDMRDSKSLVKIQFEGKEAIVEKQKLLNILGVNSPTKTRDLKTILRTKQRNDAVDAQFEADIYELLRS